MYSPSFKAVAWLEDALFIFLIFHTFVCKFGWVDTVRGKKTTSPSILKHLNQYLVDITPISYTNTWSTSLSTLDWHLRWQSVKSQLMVADMPSSVNWFCFNLMSVDWHIWVSQHSANYWLTVDWVLIEMSGSIKGIDQHSTANALSTQIWS